MDITKYLMEKTNKAMSEAKNAEQLQSIAYSEDASPESGEAEGFGDFVEGGLDDMSMGAPDMGGMGNDGFDTGFNDTMGDDFGMSDGSPGGNIPKSAMDFLETVDESEVHIVEKLMESYSSLYKEQKNVYDRLVNENLDASEFNEVVTELRKQYKLTLDVLRYYITDKFRKEVTPVRVTTFVDFKDKFDRLGKSLNQVLESVQ